jgi:outer membrane lipoprotein LolB
MGDLSHARSWSLTGKLGVRGENESANLRIHWQQAGDSFQIELSGPLGLTVAHIHGDAQGVTLETAGGQTYRAPNADELAFMSLGYRIPVRPMRYWVRGMVAPDAAYRRTADGVAQLGWQIAWLEWQDGRPRKMTFRLPDATLRLVVRRWQF